ncbi:hypothetical protein TI39_contig804g00009 [Zymoseptoria brevis]|uniref:BTB domain-containing protein n=1 Tax=Zymoseptoria brevis TaxID=1047168 RepID=A0A0F4GFQ4_9PEZI|nr:hypothetical protein TI39_contig804g00009 [Zymoseptoria brevis]
MAPPSVPGPKPTIAMYNEIVNIVVGGEGATKTFPLHKGILCHYSGYFDKALNGTFMEARNKEIILSEEEVDVFEDFVVWLYSRATPDGKKSYEKLSHLWAFADRRDVPLLMNQSLDAFRDEVVSHWTNPASSIRFIYANTTENSGLRRFAMGLVAHTADAAKSLQDTEDWPREATRDLLRLIWGTNKDAKRQSKADIMKMDMCQYHRHEPGVTCAKKTPKT